jgi:hypothetical protein
VIVDGSVWSQGTFLTMRCFGLLRLILFVVVQICTAEQRPAPYTHKWLLWPLSLATSILFLTRFGPLQIARPFFNNPAIIGNPQTKVRSFYSMVHDRECLAQRFIDSISIR